MDFVQALRCAVDCSRIPNVAGDELDIVGNLGEPARIPARIVVQRAHTMAFFDSAFTSPEPMKPLPPVTRRRLTLASPLFWFRGLNRSMCRADAIVVPHR